MEGSRRDRGPDTIIVKAYKYDGSEHRSWAARIINRKESLIVLEAKFDQEVEHELLGRISLGTVSIEYYWLDRWYSIFRFAQPAGDLRNFYCNITLPSTFDGHVLSYVDLDIDIVVEPDFSYQILDLDDFEHNATRYNYPQEVQENARRAMNELVQLIETRAFPFDE